LCASDYTIPEIVIELACQNGHISTLNMLLSYNRTMNARAAAMTYTCNRVEIVKLLVHRNEFVRSDTIVWATKLASVGLVVVLLKKYMPNEQNRSSFFLFQSIPDFDESIKEALEIACEKGHLDIVKTLITHGVIPHHRALEIAAKNNHCSIVREIRKKIDPSSTLKKAI
jgi:hypothetical protein